jgi:hypothetical protein
MGDERQKLSTQEINSKEFGGIWNSSEDFGGKIVLHEDKYYYSLIASSIGVTPNDDGVNWEELTTQSDTLINDESSQKDRVYSSQKVEEKVGAVDEKVDSLKDGYISKSASSCLMNSEALSITNTRDTLGFDSITYKGQTTSTDDTYQNGAGGTFNYVTDTLKVGHYLWNNTTGNIIVNFFYENGTTGSVTVKPSTSYINTGIGSEDFTDKNNSSDYYLHRNPDRSFAVVPKVNTNIEKIGKELSDWSTSSASLSQADNIGGKDNIWKIETTQNQGRIYHEIDLEVGKSYQIEADIYPTTDFSNGDNDWYILVTTNGLDKTDDGGEIEIFPDKNYSENSWQKVICTFIAKENSNYLTIREGGIDNTSILYIDNISLKEVSQSGECLLNISKVHLKSIDNPFNHQVCDGLRGAGFNIETNTSAAEIDESDDTLVSFANNGFILGNDEGISKSDAHFISYQTLYTHIKWGLTNQGEKYVEAFNPITKDTMIIYKGSSIIGHEVPHSLGVALDLNEIKNLNQSFAWNISTPTFDSKSGNYLQYDTDAISDNLSLKIDNQREFISLSTNGNINGLNDTHILYGKAKSQNWTIVEYIGTGASGNFIETKDINGVARKPARVILKSITAAGSSWNVLDNSRGVFDQRFDLNSNAIELNSDIINPNSNGFTLSGSTSNGANTRYIALVEFDTKANGGGSYFKKVVDDSQEAQSTLKIENANLTYTKGKDENGYILNKESFSLDLIPNNIFDGASDGYKYIYKIKDGTYAYEDNEPSFSGIYEKQFANDNRLVFDSTSGNWFESIGEAIIEDNFIDNIEGWSSYSSATLSHSNSSLKIYSSSDNFIGAQIDLPSLDIGEKYRIFFSLSTNAKNIYIKLSNFENLIQENIIIDSTSYNSYVEFTAQDYMDKVIFCTYDFSGSIEMITYLDNVSMYKSKPTLLSTLKDENISFLGKVMVSSETPQYIDNSWITPKNILEDSLVNGKLKVTEDIETNGEFKGKNACTAWVNFDGTTTPPTIRDSFNISDVVMTSTGYYEIYFENLMDNSNYVLGSSLSNGGNTLSISSANSNQEKINVINKDAINNVNENSEITNILIYGGKN